MEACQRFPWPLMSKHRLSGLNWGGGGGVCVSPDGHWRESTLKMEHA